MSSGFAKAFRLLRRSTVSGAHSIVQQTARKQVMLGYTSLPSLFAFSDMARMHVAQLGS